MGRVIVGAILSVVLLGGTGMAQQSPKRLTVDQVQTIVAAVDLLEQSCTDSEKALVSDVKLKAYTVIFLRAEDSVSAEKALAYLVARKASQEIALGLRNSGSGISVAVVKALGDVGDKTVLPQILESLNSKNRMSLSGDDGEGVAAVRVYCREAVTAIERLTKRKFDVSDPNLLSKLEKAIKETLAEPKASPTP